MAKQVYHLQLRKNGACYGQMGPYAKKSAAQADAKAVKNPGIEVLVVPGAPPFYRKTRNKRNPHKGAWEKRGAGYYYIWPPTREALGPEVVDTRHSGQQNRDPDTRYEAVNPLGGAGVRFRLMRDAKAFAIRKDFDGWDRNNSRKRNAGKYDWQLNVSTGDYTAPVDSKVGLVRMAGRQPPYLYWAREMGGDFDAFKGPVESTPQKAIASLRRMMDRRERGLDPFKNPSKRNAKYSTYSGNKRWSLRKRYPHQWSAENSYTGAVVLGSPAEFRSVAWAKRHGVPKYIVAQAKAR